MTPPPPSHPAPAPKVRVRIAVAVNADGTRWVAHGYSPGLFAGADPRNDVLIDLDADENGFIVWIEADVPLPVEQTIQGEVAP